MTPRIQAATEGRKRYETKPCKRCGSTTRYTSSGACVACTGARTITRDKRIRELLKSAQKQSS